ncbi:hypothetical protein NEOLEDRAFT_1134566 [Neolentinus lepideus HHB14362 ss-1]|uniref:separase n=1 Tax=Neolentinus lepideus HHB14362 ss-1 TaxID=1314782 RepID=A0A165SA56_9AGAM|nr:hypothetical protein NEOLEDRAFT_1134566 [Neolentinus lepideus HHB14362 ss-1]
MPPAQSTRRRAATTRVAKSKTSTPTTATTPTIDELAEQFASGLNVSNPKDVKGKRKVPAPPSQDYRRIAMRQVNEASQYLSSAVQAGWKASASSKLRPTSKTSTGSWSVSRIGKTVQQVRESLQKLRELNSDDMDVDRAASSMIGKLVNLEMYSASADLLSDIRPRLVSHCLSLMSPHPFGNIWNNSAMPEEFRLLSLPLPSSPFVDPDLLNLISMYLLYSLITTCSSIFQTSLASGVDSLPDILFNNTTLLSWTPNLSQLPAKHLDSIYTRAYTALVKSSTLCSGHPAAVLRVRVYGLLCLMHASPGAVAPDTLWDQTTKFFAVFAKSVCGTSRKTASKQEEDASNCICSCFSLLVSCAQKRSDGSNWLTGRGFVECGEYCMNTVTRTGNLVLVEQISGFLQGSTSCRPASQTESTGSSRGQSLESRTETSKTNAASCKEKQDRLVQCAKVCVSLAAVATYLENLVNSESPSEDHGQRIREVKSAIHQCKSLVSCRSADEKSQRISAKVRRALEKLRRVAVKLVDGSMSSCLNAANKHDTVDLLVDIVAVLQQVLEQGLITTEILTPAFETLFTLARTTLSVSDIDTHTPAYDFLTHARQILSLCSSSDLDGGTHANYVRCVSGAFYNTAATLYQANRHASAIRFLQPGCELGEKALHLRWKGNGEDAEQKQEESWRQLEEQMYRRWELLGVCYSKIGERKLAHDAFVECIKAFSFSSTPFVQLTKSGPCGSAFEATANDKQLGIIVDRVTYMATCELFRQPADISLKRVLSSNNGDIVGAILERQIASLDASRWKEGVVGVVETILADALAVYEPQTRPIRRARVLLQCLEASYYGNDVTRHPHEIGDEVAALLSREQFGEDAGLVQYASQYLAMSRMWQALHAHRLGDPSRVAAIPALLEETCNLLKPFTQMFSHASPRKSKSPEKAAALKATKTATKRTTGRRVVSSRTSKQDPMTPRPREALKSMSTNTPQAIPARPTQTSEPAIVFDNFGKLFGLLEMTAQLLSLLGQVPARVQILNVMRRLAERHAGNNRDGYVKACVDLAHEYVGLGKIERASKIYGQALTVVRSQQASEEAAILFLLRYAESLAITDSILRSSTSYCEAMGLQGSLHLDEKGLSTYERVKMRVCQLERAAIACSTFSAIQYSRDEPSISIKGQLQALRLWNRALDSLARLQPPPPSKPPSDDNPFDMTDIKEALPSPSDAIQSPRQPCRDGLEWRIAYGLLGTLFALTQAYFARGSAREAEYFADQALEFARSLNAPVAVGRALARKGEVQLHLAHLTEGLESLIQAANSLTDVVGPEAADIRRLRGDYHRLCEKPEDAQRLYDDATTTLEQLENAFAGLDGSLTEVRRPSVTYGKSAMVESILKDAIAPGLKATVLRQQIWLLREDGDDRYKELLRCFLELPPSTETKAEEVALMSRLTLVDVYNRFQTDMFLSSLAESTISVPMGSLSGKRTSLSPVAQDILSTLANSERLLWSGLSIISRRGQVPHVRSAVLTLALVRALQTSFGRAGNDAALAAGLLDHTSAILLRRELLEIIDSKFVESGHSDDLRWPSITPNGSPLQQSKHRKVTRQFARLELGGEESDSLNLEDPELKKYWSAIGERCRANKPDIESLTISNMKTLPLNWSIVNISVAEDKSVMFVSRRSADRQPLLFCLPLGGRRDTDEEEHLSFDSAIDELHEIIRLSDEGTRQAAAVTQAHDKAARVTWWAERSALDNRLRVLLENIEFCWLGAFKTIFAQRQNITPEILASFRASLDKVLRHSLKSLDKRRRNHIRLDDSILECFCALSPQCRDEELEDLVYFVLDFYQLHGAQVAIAEVDLDQVAVDVRLVLEEYSTKLRPVENDEHIFLVLDKNVHEIPWESLPILRGRSVSRIPSSDFLLDRLDYVKLHRMAAGDDGELADRVVVNSEKVYCVLNPSGDLKATEGRFRDWVTGMRKVGWDGIIGRQPSELEFANALSSRDLVIYFGHGGGEQYVRSHKIRHLKCCAATMLWGCSSGALRVMGDFDPIGTPYNYMLAGCPTLVANLWDVTDRDIDKFSQAVFDKLDLTQDGVRNRKTGKSSRREVSIVEAVAKSRDACKLKYLTGAAPIVYGIPFYL